MERNEVDIRKSDSLLDLILRKYSHSARDSIRGPVANKGDFHAFTHNINKPQQLIVPHKQVAGIKKEVLLTDEIIHHEKDNCEKLRETNLDGHMIGCFNVGGEKRVCFTELVRVVLKDIVLVHEIFSRRDELLIYCAQCTPQQLVCLKLAGILPWTSTSSNLITKSDAYRLCGVLYGTRAPQSNHSRNENSQFEVFHECFGGCVGKFSPEDYTEPSSACIRCSECRRLFSTRKFVSHNHTAFDEVHTCHWGFESSRWRSYLMLVEQNPNSELQRVWEGVKKKFDGHRLSKVAACNSPDLKEDADFVAYVKSPERHKTTVSPIESLRNDRFNENGDSEVVNSSTTSSHQTNDRQSAFHPWSPTPSSNSGGIQSNERNRFVFPSTNHTEKVKSLGCASNGSNPTCNNVTTDLQSSNVLKNNTHESGFHLRGHSHSQLNNNHGHAVATSQLYLSCHQCKAAASTSTCTGLQLLAQKASERPTSHCHESPNDRLDGAAHVCNSGYGNNESFHHRHRTNSIDSLEATIDDIVRRFTPSDPRQFKPREFINVLTGELKRLNLTQDDKLREYSVCNQRLQTEVHLVKLEYQRKLSEALDAKRRVEQELEVVQREHQKDIVRFNHFTLEYQREMNHHTSDQRKNDAASTIDALRDEISLLRAELKQCNQSNTATVHTKFRPWQTNPKSSSSGADAIKDCKPRFAVLQNETSGFPDYSWTGKSVPTCVLPRETGSKSLSVEHISASLSKKIKHSTSDPEINNHSDDSDVDIED